MAEALRAGERPDLATTRARGPLHELVGWHEDLGIFASLDAVEVRRARAAIPDALLLRTRAMSPLVEQASLRGGSSVGLREPAILLPLGWAPVHIRSGSHGQQRHPERRQEESLPCHADTWRDAALAGRGVRLAEGATGTTRWSSMVSRTASNMPV